MSNNNDKQSKTNVKFIFVRKWRAYIFLFVGIILSLVFAYYTKKNIEEKSNVEYSLICNEIKIKITTRLFSHAQLLRSGSSFLASSDTITRLEWKAFYDNSKLHKNLPGIQGLGFSIVIPKDKLKEHIINVRKEGFPNYTLQPEYDRDFYTSIIYLEPFTGRNLRAFGYDMFSEPIRRKAMEQSRDNDVASLSGKVLLVQETNEDVQAGTLMYVPVYAKNQPHSSIEERRKAIIGWVYSPYRMNDLMNGILGRWDQYDQKRIQLQIYDDWKINQTTLLYDSQQKEKFNSQQSNERVITIPLQFNGKSWLLRFTQHISSNPFYEKEVVFSFIAGASISFFLFSMYLSLINLKFRAKEISELNASKDKFFSIIAHDLRSPFNGFLGLTKIMAEDIDKFSLDDLKEISISMQASASNLFELLENLLEWSRMQRNMIIFNPEPCTLSMFVAKNIDLQHELIRKKELNVVNGISDELILSVDPNSLNIVLRNLISNAIKFTPKGGEIVIGYIESKSNEAFARIFVKDSGIGIPHSLAVKLFKIDENVSRSGTDNESSSGLGLLLCKEYIEKHNGKIWAESEEGKGSTFYFTLPIV